MKGFDPKWPGPAPLTLGITLQDTETAIWKQIPQHTGAHE